MYLEPMTLAERIAKINRSYFFIYDCIREASKRLREGYPYSARMIYDRRLPSEIEYLECLLNM